MMIIVYESKTGFTKRYAEMLAEKTGLKALSVKEISQIKKDEEIIFLGWLKVGSIQGLKKVRNHNIKAVCATGTAQKAEPSTEAVIERNGIKGTPFFYLRGGCLPLNEIKGMDKILLKLFVRMLKSRKDKDAKTLEAIHVIENGFDGVDEKNLKPVIEWAQNGTGGQVPCPNLS